MALPLRSVHSFCLWFRPRHVRIICGRARLSSDVNEIKLIFSADGKHVPSWNVAQTDPFTVVHCDPRAGERSLDVMPWGLVSFWAKVMKVSSANINAKAEGTEGKPAFREAFQRRRASSRSITLRMEKTVWRGTGRLWLDAAARREFWMACGA